MRPADDVDAFGPQVLRDYAIVADGRRGALIGPRGEIVWLCAPTWDSAGVLDRLVGGDGVYAVTPVDTFVWSGSYEEGSLVWHSRWTTTTTTLACHEALALPSDPHRVVLLRRIVGGDRDAAADVTLRLSGGFGRPPAGTWSRDEQGRWTLDLGPLSARWSGAWDARLEDGALRWRVQVPAGTTLDLVLEVADRPLGPPVDPAQAWADTRARWADDAPDFARTAAPRDARQAYALLRGLTAEHGGMVAAATLGLPERADARRNYDYRYVWVRDQAYAGLACAVDEPLGLLDDALAFTSARILEHGPTLVPAYRQDGSPVPPESRLPLPGYPGGSDVVGNRAGTQFQLDAFGEFLQLVGAALRLDHVEADHLAAARVAVRVIADRWDDPDAGIWELDDAWWTHSRLACVAGLRAFARGLAGPETTRVEDLADTLLAETSRRSLAAGGYWLRRPGRPGVDAALTLPAVRGATAPDDPRTLATLREVERTLVRDGFVYRFRHGERPLGDAEGAFTLCGFMLSLAHLQQGDAVRAFRSFDQHRTVAGSPGVLAEEFDVRARQLRGNLPQAFVHAMLLETAQRLPG